MALFFFQLNSNYETIWVRNKIALEEKKSACLIEVDILIFV